MALWLTQVMSSEIFEFVVENGKVYTPRHRTIDNGGAMYILSTGDKTSFMVHSGLIGALSSALDALITSPMREAHEKKVELHGVDALTFAKVCEFAYTGDYKLRMPPVLPSGLQSPDKLLENTLCLYDEPLPEMKPSARPSLSPCENAQAHTFVPQPSTNVHSREDLESQKKIIAMRKSFCLSFQDSTPPPLNNLDRFLRPLRSCSPAQQTELLQHAKIYVFANMWEVKRLRWLSLKRCHEFLQRVDQPQTSVLDVIATIEYLHGDDPKSDWPIVSEADQLRTMLMHFACCEIKALIKHKKFLCLLERGGKFASQMMEKVVQGLV